MKRKTDVGPVRTMRVEALEARRMLAFAGLPIQISGTGADFGQEVSATPDGGFIAAGMFFGTVDFDPGAGVTSLTSQSDTDIYIAKYSSTGALEWARQIGGKGKDGRIKDQDRIIDIAADPRRAGDLFINGVTTMPKNAGEFVTDIVVDTDGSVVVVGEFVGTVDFATVNGTRTFRTFDHEYYDFFVTRFSPTGQMVWARQFGDRFTDTANAATIDPSGNILVTGLFTRTVSFAPGIRNLTLTARGRADGYAMKLTSNGAVVWVNPWGSDATNAPVRDVGNDITTDAAGNVYVAGQFTNTSDFDPSATGVFHVTGKDDGDGVLIKYSPAGRLRAVLPFGGNRFDALTHVAVDSNLDIVVAGYFQGEKFDADPTSTERLLRATPKEQGDDPEKLDVFIEKLSRGRVAWVQQVKGDRSEFISDLEIDSGNNIIVTGAWYGSATFGTGPTRDSVRGPDEFRDRNDDDRGESYDAFLWKLASNGTTSFLTQLGAEEDDFGNGISLGSDDSILMTGRFDSTVDFDTGAGSLPRTARGLSDAFIAAFDTLGNSQF